MARYRARIKGYDGEALRYQDEEFDFFGAPGAWMIPLDPPSEPLPATPIKQIEGNEAGADSVPAQPKPRKGKKT